MGGRTTLALATLAALAGCDGRPAPSAADSTRSAAGTARPAAALAGAPEAVSFLGEPLLPLAFDSVERRRRQARLDSAEAAVSANPEDPEALIWLGRHLGYNGRYRDAIEVFTEGAERFPSDARFYRHRGHRYITLRAIDRAIADLQHAVRLVTGQEDVVEPDGLPNPAGIPRSTLQTNIWYHLGVARYIDADYDGAAHAFRQGFRLARNDDMRVAMADWLWMSLMRLDRPAEADQAIAFVDRDLEIFENDAYHRRLLLYKGLLPPDSLLGGAGWEPGSGEGDRALEIATYGYGLGTWYQVNGDPLRARARYEDVIETGYWPAFGYIAAEVALARMRGLEPAPPPVDSVG